jgi:hypothetical protein
VADGDAPVNAALVRLLEQALAGAKAGSFRGGGVVLVDGDGLVHHFANVGQFAFFMPLIAGAAVLQMDLQMTMKAQAQGQAFGASRLRAVPEQIKPRGGGLDG